MASLGAGTALAQTEAAGIKLGDTAKFYPSLNVDNQYDDNVTNASQDEIDSWVAVINPNFLLMAEDGLNVYKLNYAITKGEYADSSEDNYTDHVVNGSAEWDFSFRHRLGLFGTYQDTHEARGSGFSEGSGATLDEPDTFTDADVFAKYGFGALSAQGRIDLVMGAKDRNFDRRTVIESGSPVDATATRDRETSYGSATFFYNTGGKTEVLVEVAQRDITYDFTTAGTAQLDSNETDYLVGVTWEGSARTTGTAKIGSRRKDFDDPSRKDFTGPRWEVGVRWEPRTYSAFDVNTSRRSEETNGAGNFIDVASYELAWHHKWMERLATTVSYNFADNDYEGVDRRDESRAASVIVNYQMRRSLSFNAKLNYSEQDSDLPGLDYERSIVSIGVQAAL